MSVRSWVASIGLWTGLAVAAEGGAPTDVESLRQCLSANLPAHSLVQEVRLIAKDSAGGRELQARVYGMKLNEEVAVMVDVRAPVDMSGSRYLVISGAERDAMYLYLPALNRTRRVVGSMAGQSLWGTDFSYEDVKLFRGMLNHGALDLRPVEWSERPAVALTITPQEPDHTAYTRVNLTIDGATCVVVGAEFLDESGIVKTMSVNPKDLVVVDDRWWARKVTMHSARRNSQSELIVDDYSFDPELRARLFDPRAFQQGR